MNACGSATEGRFQSQLREPLLARSNSLHFQTRTRAAPRRPQITRTREVI